MPEPLATRPPLPEVFGNYAIKGIEEVLAPAPVSWFPVTPGWQFLGLVLLLLLAWRAWLQLQRWRRNGYRRDALAHLKALRESGDPPVPQLLAIARLLKATAIAAYPRSAVASLSGRAWLSWLNSSTATPLFSGPAAELLESAQYRRSAPQPTDMSALFKAAEQWIEAHPEPTVD